MEGCDAQSSVSILSQAVLKEARIIEYASTLPCAVGVHISCVPNQEVTRTGVGYAFTALPESTNSTTLVVYENDATTAESMAWRAQYPEYNSLNLETQGVLNVQGESFVFVSKAHPVIDLLRANKDVLKADIDKQTLIDDQWVRARPRAPARARRSLCLFLSNAPRAQLKVTKQVMSTCCGQIKTKVLNKVGTVDLSNITMQICRIDAPWKQMTENDPLFAKIPQHLTTAPDPPADESMRAKWDEEQTARQTQFTAECSKLFRKPMAFHCRFELTFDLLPISI